jgi:hypothetical protein
MNSSLTGHNKHGRSSFIAEGGHDIAVIAWKQNDTEPETLAEEEERLQSGIEEKASLVTWQPKEKVMMSSLLIIGS